jgi:NADPH:quinone reductase-like Zn-dependent oxidoreductase
MLVAVVLGIGAFTVAYARSTNDCPLPGGTVGDGNQAWIQCEFGAPDVLRLHTFARPTPSDSEVLVRVHAVSLNPADWHYMRGTPYLARMVMGLRKPSAVETGTDFAGVVAQVGAAVTTVTVGDTVFGAANGAFRQWVTVRASRVVRKPVAVTLEQAASIPVAGITALQGVRDHGKVGPGMRVLVNGASGGVGTFAVQIAKALGAQVTGVCSSRNVELVQSLGAERVIDYTREDFTATDERYDVIVDMVGNHPLGALRRVLTPTGTYVMIGGSSGSWVDPLPRVAMNALYDRFGDQRMRFFIAKITAADLGAMQRLIEAGQVQPVIDKTYPFSELPQAMRYLETGRARGKVVVRVTE